MDEPCAVLVILSAEYSHVERQERDVFGTVLVKHSRSLRRSKRRRPAIFWDGDTLNLDPQEVAEDEESVVTVVDEEGRFSVCVMVSRVTWLALGR